MRLPRNVTCFARRQWWCLLLAWETTALLLTAAPDVEWTLHKSTDGARPNAEEQQLLWLMNRARQDPAAEGEWLANSKHSAIEQGLQAFKVNREVLKREFAALEPQPPAVFDFRLHLGMVDHAGYLIDLDALNRAAWHAGQAVRAQAHGFVINGGSHSAHPTAKSGLETHAALNIDWGVDEGGADGTGMQSTRSHRNAIMGTEVPNKSWTWSNVGIAYEPATGGTKNLGPNVAAIFYAFAHPLAQDHYDQFIVGTVWTDKNGNGIYDAGEGHANVRVQPDRGTYFAITGAAGGYAIPITETGQMKLTFSGGALGGESVVRQVAVASESVLVPWEDGGQDQSELPVLAVRYAQSAGELTLSWEGRSTDVLEESKDGLQWNPSSLAVGIDASGIFSARMKPREGDSQSQIFRVRR